MLCFFKCHSEVRSDQLSKIKPREDACSALEPKLLFASMILHDSPFFICIKYALDNIDTGEVQTRGALYINM